MGKKVKKVVTYEEIPDDEIEEEEEKEEKETKIKDPLKKIDKEVADNKVSTRTGRVDPLSLLDFDPQDKNIFYVEKAERMKKIQRDTGVTQPDCYKTCRYEGEPEKLTPEQLAENKRKYWEYYNDPKHTDEFFRAIENDIEKEAKDLFYKHQNEKSSNSEVDEYKSRYSVAYEKEGGIFNVDPKYSRL